MFAGSSLDVPDYMAAPGPVMDRRMYAAMALLYFLTVLLGFIPSSLDKMAAVTAGHHLPFPVELHLHAVLMGSWMLLLLAQTTLMATGRVALHRTLGLVAFVLAPAMVLMIVLAIRATWQDLAATPPEMLAPAALATNKMIRANVMLEQMRSLTLFPLFFVWAVAVRRKDQQMHMRMMMLATLALLSAAIDRLASRWLPTGFPLVSYDAEYLYLVLWMSPLLVYDLLRLGRLHRAWVIGLASLVPFALNTHFLWNSPWWQSVAPKLIGISGW